MYVYVPEGIRHEAVKEEVHGGVDGEEDVGGGSHQQHPQREPAAVVVVILFNLTEATCQDYRGRYGKKKERTANVQQSTYST